MAKVLVYFGRYEGTVRANGFFWVSPLHRRRTISLRIRNLDSDVLKVNDAVGNPVEIAAVINWQVFDTAKALFNVEQYQSFVHIQTETAVRHVASEFPYDNYDDDGLSLRASAVVGACQLIVEGAVGMVHHALPMLREQNVVELDQERKATMVSNLLVVLCSDRGVQPVVNAGSLY